MARAPATVARTTSGGSLMVGMSTSTAGMGSGAGRGTGTSTRRVMARNSPVVSAP